MGWDYDAQTGRWLTKDPIRFNGSAENIYGYTANDPINFVDRNGKWATAAAAAIVVVEGIRTAAAWSDVKSYEAQANKMFPSNDKTKHEWVSQQIASDHGADIALIYGIGKELFDLTPWGGNPEWDDLIADLKGVGKACGF